jgi:hypothetical protein
MDNEREYVPNMGPCQRGRSLRRDDLAGWADPCPRPAEYLMVVDFTGHEQAAEFGDLLTMAFCLPCMDDLKRHGVEVA